jgi:hypothetical protein
MVVGWYLREQAKMAIRKPPRWAVVTGLIGTALAGLWTLGRHQQAAEARGQHG